MTEATVQQPDSFASSTSETPKVAWVSSRRTSSIFPASSPCITKKYILYQLLCDKELSFDEFRTVDLVVMEIPPIAKTGYEHELHRLVTGIRAVGTHVAMIVQPSIRKKNVRCLWIQKWNYLPQVPFKFTQTCSCRVPHAPQQYHITHYICCSFDHHLGSCEAVPTLGVSLEVSVASLGALSVSLTDLWRQSCMINAKGRHVHPEVLHTTCAFRRSASRNACVEASAGLWRTPDSQYNNQSDIGHQYTAPHMTTDHDCT